MYLIDHNFELLQFIFQIFHLYDFHKKYNVPVVLPLYLSTINGKPTRIKQKLTNQSIKYYGWLYKEV